MPIAFHPLAGTDQDDQIDGTSAPDHALGLAGDDTITGGAGHDRLIGDFAVGNLLSGTAAATGFADFQASGAWSLSNVGGGHAMIAQSVATVSGATYRIDFSLAANLGAGVTEGAVEVLWNGESLGRFDSQTGLFADHSLTAIGSGGSDTVAFRTITPEVSSGPTVLSDLQVLSYDAQVQAASGLQTVRAFAEGQAKFYQVLNGTLNVFDPEAQEYVQAGSAGTVVVNAIGFNTQDNLIYGIAVGNGVDSQGQTVSGSDLVMLDAKGDSYRIGETPYRSWTGDFDDQGNLWVFGSSLDRVTRIDVGSRDASGNPLTETFRFDAQLFTDHLWDAAFDPGTQSFIGATRPSSAGAPSQLVTVDISGVASGGAPVITSETLGFTRINGEVQTGIPAITFGAAIRDASGTIYVGGNGGDHDMNGATRNSGGIYRVVTDASGAQGLELISDAPKSYSNDGAADARALNPFAAPNTSAQVLLKGVQMVAAAAADQSYDDHLFGGAGQDTALGGLGLDLLVGASRGDDLSGNDGNDALYGGAGPDAGPGVISVYDDAGNRFDPAGTVLPEDDDRLSGGAGDDLLDGSAGHDTLLGEDGQDQLSGGSGSDHLLGGAGDDTMSGGSQNDTLDGGDGQDQLSGGSGNDHLCGGAGADQLSGGSGGDQLNGGRDADTLNGGSGDDRIDGGGDNDRIDGGSSHDMIQGGDGHDRIKSGSGNDTIEGGAGNDYINAHSGDDVIDGGAGRDKIYLGSGADMARGGSGADTFVFRTDTRDGRENRILDLVCDGPEADRLDLRALNLLAEGQGAADWLVGHITLGSGAATLDLEGATLVLDGLSGSMADITNALEDSCLF